MRGYPTFKLFQNGQKVADYSGGRQQGDFVSYMKEQGGADSAKTELWWLPHPCNVLVESSFVCCSFYSFLTLGILHYRWRVWRFVFLLVKFQGSGGFEFEVDNFSELDKSFGHINQWNKALFVLHRTCVAVTCSAKISIFASTTALQWSEPLVQYVVLSSSRSWLIYR